MRDSDLQKTKKVTPKKVDKKALLGLSTLLASTASNAAVDVGATAATITADGTAAITVIGTAMLGLAAVAIVFKWAKASIFG